MTTIIEQKQHRASLIAKAKNLIQTAESAARDFTTAEEREYDDLDQKIEAASRQIRNRERSEQLDRDRAGSAFSPGADDEEADAFLNGETRSLTVDMAGVARDHRAGARAGLTAGSPAGGGATTPQGFAGRLYEHLVASSAIRQTNVTVHTTPDGRDLHLPRTTEHTSAEIIPEGGTIPEDDPQFDEVVLGAHKYGRLLRLSAELNTDTGVDLVGYLARSAGKAIGNASGEHFITGSGEGQPEGVTTAATTGVDAAAADAVTADELMNLYFSVLADYRRNGFWMMNDVTWAKIRQITDGNQRHLVGDLGSGGSPQLMGRPVVIDPFMPAPEAGQKAILFGDFSGYHIREHAQLRFERSDQYAFEQDQIVFRALHRLDGKLVDNAGAIKALVMSAA